MMTDLCEILVCFIKLLTEGERVLKHSDFLLKVLCVISDSSYYLWAYKLTYHDSQGFCARLISLKVKNACVRK